MEIIAIILLYVIPALVLLRRNIIAVRRELEEEEIKFGTFESLPITRGHVLSMYLLPLIPLGNLVWLVVDSIRTWAEKPYIKKHEKWL